MQWLVIGLTITLIVGVIVTVAALVTRMPGRAPAVVSLPDAVKLPDGVDATAVTFGPGWYAVVTTDSRILIYDRATGVLKQDVVIEK